jgi:hypothetical protein
MRYAKGTMERANWVQLQGLERQYEKHGDAYIPVVENKVLLYHEVYRRSVPPAVAGPIANAELAEAITKMARLYDKGIISTRTFIQSVKDIAGGAG